MSDETILRIAAKGDGVTASGAHHAGAVTGDIVNSDGSFTRGKHYQEPPCKHFTQCGGCSLQYADEKVLSQFALERVLYAAEGKGVEAKELLPTHLSPPKSRRRATLHAVKRGKNAQIGFRQAGSHKIVDLTECHILVPELFALAKPLRTFIAKHGGKAPIDIDLTLTDQGADVSIKQIELDGLEATEAALEFAQANSLARLSLDMGYGAEPIWEPEPVTITLANTPVAYPSGAFLQATRDAEALMMADAAEMLSGAGKVVDLFAGLGTFAFALSKQSQLTAVEAARDAHLACRAAASRAQLPVEAMHRDLFRNPLQDDELKHFDAALLDPPRAGARDQIAAIAASGLQRVCYISCNPASWSRDAKQLVEAGFTLQKLRPIGQFRWTTHVELVSYFTR
ncbi:MAG: class I SAM-dependent RNA methyltransferase [Erythrobacter sp.]